MKKDPIEIAQNIGCLLLAALAVFLLAPVAVILGGLWFKLAWRAWGELFH